MPVPFMPRRWKLPFTPLNCTSSTASVSGAPPGTSAKKLVSSARSAERLPVVMFHCVAYRRPPFVGRFTPFRSTMATSQSAGSPLGPWASESVSS